MAERVYQHRAVVELGIDFSKLYFIRNVLKDQQEVVFLVHRYKSQFHLNVVFEEESEDHRPHLEVPHRFSIHGRKVLFY